VPQCRSGVRGPAAHRPAGQVPRGGAAPVSAPGAVIIGGYANGVSALRGLAREGVRTAVILTREQDIAQHSRYAHEVHRVHYLNRRPDGLIELLEAQRDRWKGW